jgi:hypothetical protein
MEEIWKPLRGFEDYAKVSNKGNVLVFGRWVNNNFGQRFMPEKLLTQHKTRGKYVYRFVTLHIDNKKHSLFTARIVYETFNEISLNRKFCVVHKDGNIDNCNLDNIKIITRRDKQNLVQNKTGYNGVYKASNGGYSAQIVFEGKRLTVHSSISKQECMKIYQLAKSLINNYEKDKIKILENSKLNNKIIQKQNKIPLL